MYILLSIIGRYHKLRLILAQYNQSGNEDTAYQALVLNSHWGRAYVARKDKQQLDALHEHVQISDFDRIIYLVFVVYALLEDVR